MTKKIHILKTVKGTQNKNIFQNNTHFCKIKRKGRSINVIKIIYIKICIYLLIRIRLFTTKIINVCVYVYTPCRKSRRTQNFSLISCKKIYLFNKTFVKKLSA